MSIPEDPAEKFDRLLKSEEETQAEPPAGEATPARELRLPALDQDNMPLPQRVEELDREGTTVTPAAFERSAATAQRRTDTATTKRTAIKQTTPKTGRRPAGRKTLGCLLRGLVISLFAGTALVLLLAAAAIYIYYDIASGLPPVDDLQTRAAQFETTRILDRNGGLLYEINDPSAGKRTFVPLEEISPSLVAATIAIEDKDFYTHKGFDPLAILRAFWYNLQSGETVSGASTITQQLARALVFTPEERVEQTYLRKVREALLAIEIERRFSKDDILELYLNENYYGNLAYGIEAAAETYFRKSAAELTLGEAAFLAGLPQAPSVYDVYTNRDYTLVRFQYVLLAMLSLSNERGCLQVSNSPSPVCVDGPAAAAALQEITGTVFIPPVVDMRYPHWVQYIRTQLETLYDPQTIYRSGFTVTTSIDPVLQDAAQQAITDQVAAIANLNVHGGALVAIHPATGEILAMVGSPDFYDEIYSGQVNMAVSPTRQPGSSIKPITYLAAFEKGWTVATLIWDVPSEFPPSGLEDDPAPPYIPTNYSHNFWGPVTVRSALANSLNIPAVKALQYVGVYDDPTTPRPDGLIGMAGRLGITSLTRTDYGLALTLGGGEVSLLEMTGAYAVLANAGVRIPPTSILEIIDFQGETVFRYEPPRGESVVDERSTYLVTSIISDRAARAPVFGLNSILNLPFPAAVKTGTSNDARDNWTIGYTPDLAVGVWVGNPDYSPMGETTGVTGAGPAWAQFMTFAVPHLTNDNPTPFSQPQGITEQTICTISGTQPSQWCPERREEIFDQDHPALPPEEDLWREVEIDTWTGLLASESCSDFTRSELVLNVTEGWALNWIRQEEKGRQWARDMGFDEDLFFIPERECTASDPHARLEFTSPVEGSTISENPFEIRFRAESDLGLRDLELEYDDGSGGVLLADDMQGALSYNWDLTGLPAGTVTLQLRMENEEGGFAERRVQVNLAPPTATPTASDTPIPSATPTPTPSETPLATSTETSPVPTRTRRPTSTEQPPPTPTVEPSPTPSETPPPTPT